MSSMDYESDDDLVSYIEGGSEDQGPLSFVLSLFLAPFRLWHGCVSRQRKSHVGIWKWIHKTDARAALFWAVIIGIPVGLLFAVLFAVPAAFIPDACRATLHVSWIPGCNEEHDGDLPVVRSLNASDITLYSATLHGSVGPPGMLSSELEYFFYFGSHGNSRENKTNLLHLGNGTANFSRRVSGLEPQTSYQVSAAVQTIDGSPVVSDVTTIFSTLEAPSVETKAVSNISTTSAGFSLSVTRNGWSSLRGFFSYGTIADASISGPTSSPDSCSPSYVLRPISTHFLPLEQLSNLSTAVYGLHPDTNYAVTAGVINSRREIVCSTMTASFRTSALPPPIVTTDSPSGVSPTTATLHGTVNTQGWQDLNYLFFYGTVKNPKEKSTALLPLNGSGPVVHFTANVADLTPETTFVFQAAVKNSELKETLGNVVQLKTPSAPPPNVTTLFATNITQTTAIFHGMVDTGAWQLQYFFLYSPEGSSHEYHTTPQNLFGNGKGVPFSSPVRSGQNHPLDHNTTYIVSAGVVEIGPNHHVVSNKTVKVKTLAIPPVVYTLDPGNVTNQSATFRALVIPGSWTRLGIYFLYGPESNVTKYRSSVKPTTFDGANSSVDVPIENLAANVDYTFQAFVHTSQGDYQSPNATSFRTGITVLTGDADNVTFYSATLHGTVNTLPSQKNLTFHFCYGPSYHPRQFCSPKQPLVGSGAHVPFHTNVPMVPNVTYSFFAVVGKVESQDVHTVTSTLPPKGGLVQIPGPIGCIGFSERCESNLTLAGSISKMDLSTNEKYLYFAGVGHSQIELGIGSWTGTKLSQLPGNEGCFSGNGNCLHARGFRNGSSLGNVVLSPDDSSLYIGGGIISKAPTGTLESFSRSSSGKLTQLSSSSGCLVENASSHASANGCGTTSCFGGVVRDIVVSPNGKFAYVAQGYDVPAPPLDEMYSLRGALLAFSRASSGALSLLSPQKEGCTYFSADKTQNPSDCSNCGKSDTLGFPSALTISPDGDSLFVASYWQLSLAGPRSNSVGWVAFHAYDIHEDGTLYYKGCWSNYGNMAPVLPCNSPIPDFPHASFWSADTHLALGVSPDSRFVYFSASNYIAIFSVDDYLNVELKGCYGPTSKSGCTGVPELGLIGGLTSITISKDGAYMFAQGNDGLLVFSRDDGSGSLTRLQCFGNFSGVVTSCSPVAALRGVSHLAAMAVGPNVLFGGGQGESGPAIAIFSIV